jgi:hypothetical protein
MKTFLHLWQYLAELFLEWEIFQIKVVEKIKTHILCTVTFFRKLRLLWDNVQKCGGAKESTNDVTIWRIRDARRTGKATRAHAHTHGTHTHAHGHEQTHKYVILLFHGNNDSRTRLNVTFFRIFAVLLSASSLCFHSSSQIDYFFWTTSRDV